MEIDGDVDGLSVQGDSITLKRGQTETIKITRTQGTPHANQTEMTSASPTFGSGPTPSAQLQEIELAVADFNQRKQVFHLKHSHHEQQPDLSAQEVIAYASWKLEYEKNLPKSLEQCLRQISMYYRLNPDWEFTGRFLQTPVGDSTALVYQLALVNRRENVRDTIRERCISAQKINSSVLSPQESGGKPLAAAIQGFNNRYESADGQVQPKLTEEEVVAAILHWQSKRNEADVDNALFAQFQNIAKTRQLPEGTVLEVLSHLENGKGTRYCIWSIRILMPHLEKG